MELCLIGFGNCNFKSAASSCLASRVTCFVAATALDPFGTNRQWAVEYATNFIILGNLAAVEFSRALNFIHLYTRVGHYRMLTLAMC